MITICMNDRQHVITYIGAPICMSGNQSMYLSFFVFFYYYCFFFHHSKIILIVFF